MKTLEIAETLEGIGIEHRKAYDLAETINGKSGLATKEDIAQVKSELKEDIAEVKSEIAEVKSELKQDIAEVKSDIKWIQILGVIILGLIIKIAFFN